MRDKASLVVLVILLSIVLMIVIYDIYITTYILSNGTYCTQYAYFPDKHADLKHVQTFLEEKSTMLPVEMITENGEFKGIKFFSCKQLGDDQLAHDPLYRSFLNFLDSMDEKVKIKE